MRATQVTPEQSWKVELDSSPFRTIVQNLTGWPAFAGHDKCC
jgi:hypothetical protein